MWTLIFAILSLPTTCVLSAAVPNDPCALISGKRWVSPAQARACMTASPLEPKNRANIIEVVSKTLPFHASESYQLQAPSPFETTHVDLNAELTRLNNTQYSSEFEFHLDMYRTFQRANDGHLGVYNYCYDYLYETFLPLPLVLLTDESDGKQEVFIAPEAFKVASEEFEDQIEFWQDELPDQLKGNLAALSGAKVLLIDGEHPLVAVNSNAEVRGVSQSIATRQNMFFSSYGYDAAGWNYNLGDFARRIHPVVDSVQLTVERPNSSHIDTFTIPYRSRANNVAKKNIKDVASYRQSICRATSDTNGYDRYSRSAALQPDPGMVPVVASPHQEYGMKLANSYLPIQHGSIPSYLPVTDVALPSHLRPASKSLKESQGGARFYMLDDQPTGVLVMGTFNTINHSETAFIAQRLLEGLQTLQDKGAERLIVDVTNNGGGDVYLAHWLYRILMGHSDKTFPQAGLDSATRAAPLAQLIVDQIISNNVDPQSRSYYNPARWRNAKHQRLSLDRNWLKTGPKLVINGKNDAYSERLGQESQPFLDTLGLEPPHERLFDPKNILIVSNGACYSSCSLFTVRMSKTHGVRTVVAGGQNNVRQEYCGTVGGQMSNFRDIDIEIKSAKLKNHTLAPPDLLSHSAMRFTWRLGYGVHKPNEPEGGVLPVALDRIKHEPYISPEWQPHWADIAFPLTLQTVNNPEALWKSLANQYLSTLNLFQVQEP